ncbi:MAG TPA: hypothetical protein VI094_10275 [Propionibacteriaceae bacterium]
MERSVRRKPWASVGLRAGDPGPLVCVGTRIERVEYGQLSVLDHQGGVVDRIECGSALSAVAAGGNANDHRRSTRRMPLVAAIVDGRARYLDLLRLTVRSSDVLWSRYADSYIGFGLTPLMAIGLKKDKKGAVMELI